ncbi:MAG: bifunctional phosphoglucose/phosphomannose isomerase [Candidatus Krumholzibacteriia bacterium]
MSRWPEGGSGRMLHLVDRLADQLLESAGLPGLDEAAAAGPAPARVVLCGMGGSAIAGDLVAPLLPEVQLAVHRDYGLPRWAGADDLVIVSSYSGDTQEALAGWDEAGRRGCRRLALTSGGALAALAAARDVPVVRLPGGLPPRASLGYGLGALVRVLGLLQALPDAAAEVEAAAAGLRAAAPGRLAPYARAGEASPVPADEPPARAVAESLHGRVAVIHTAGAEAHAAGLRLKAQLNENAKVPALLAAYPELDHNELVGWAVDQDLRDRFVLLILRGRCDHERLDRRVAVTRGLLAGQFAAVHEIAARGQRPLARIMSLVQYGDFVSCHLADLRGIDPVPVDRITRLKAALAEGPGA